MTKDEALKLALEALKLWLNHKLDEDTAWEAHNAIKEALETKDEPVGFIAPNGEFRKTTEAKDAIEWGVKFKPLYTTPQRTWVGLTDEEKAQFVVAYYPSNWDRKTAVSLMNDYEKYLKEKNNV